MLKLILLYAICATTFTASKWMLFFADPIFGVGCRMIIAGVVLLSYYLYLNRNSISKAIIMRKQDIWLFIKIIIFHIYLTYLLDFCALKNLSSIESSIIYNFSPFITSIFSYFILKEKLRFNQFVGLAFGFISFVPDLLNFYYNPHSSSMLPKLINLGAVFTAAYGWIIMSELVKIRHYNAVFVNGIGMFFGGLLALITSVIFLPSGQSYIYNYSGFAYSLIATLILSNLIYYNLYGYLLKFYSPTLISFAGLLCPMFTMLFGYIFLGESIGMPTIVSFCLISIGLYFFTKPSSKIK